MSSPARGQGDEGQSGCSGVPGPQHCWALGRAAAAGPRAPSLPTCTGCCSAVNCASALRVLTPAEALHALGHQGVALDPSVILKSRDLILKPFTISRHTQAEGGTWLFQSDQWSVALPAARHLHRGAATPVPPVFPVLGCCFEGAHESEGSQGCQQGSWAALTFWWGPWWPRSHPCKGSSASAAVPLCASRICPCSSGFCTDPQPPQVKEFKSCPSNQL